MELNEEFRDIKMYLMCSGNVIDVGGEKLQKIVKMNPKLLSQECPAGLLYIMQIMIIFLFCYFGVGKNILYCGK